MVEKCFVVEPEDSSPPSHKFIPDPLLRPLM